MSDLLFKEYDAGEVIVDAKKIIGIGRGKEDNQVTLHMKDGSKVEVRGNYYYIRRKVLESIRKYEQG